MNITLRHEGDFSPLEKFLNKLKKQNYLNILSKYGQEGVAALAAATPVDTGLTASSWSYEILQQGDHTELIWSNTNVNKGYNIALLIQYGHGTGNGAYISGVDYINPALAPVFDRLVKDLWKEVSEL